MNIYLIVVGVITLLSCPLIRPEPLEVVIPGWRPRTREIRGARRSSRVSLFGEPKRHGEKKMECPERTKFYPCRCKEKRKGLDIICEKAEIDDLQRATTMLKEASQGSKVDFTIGYFKIRDSSMRKLPDYVFMGLNIVHLMIYNSDLSALMPNSLTSLASTLRHLVLSNNNLDKVPTLAIRQLKNLDHLNLGQNKISVLEDGAFWGLHELTRLSLYDNKIHKIHLNAFDGLTKNLLRLSLVKNQLTEVPKESLLSLTNLNQLTLTENRINHISANTFLGLDKLDSLDIGHNNLTEVGQSYFDGLPRLASLTLDYNKISNIHPQAFKGLEENLQSLSITHNKLNSIPSASLRPLHQLTTLHLDDNNITRVKADDFKGYGEHIKNLWLQNNHINTIDDEGFEDLHSLEWLKLWNNNLVSLHYSLMEPILDTLKHLDIHSNPLVCDCEMRWYKKWYNDGWQDVDEDHIKDTTCFSPHDHQDHPIKDVNLYSMFCVKALTVRGISGTVTHSSSFISTGFIILLASIMTIF